MITFVTAVFLAAPPAANAFDGEAELQTALEALQAGRFGLANDLFTQILTASTLNSPDVLFHAAKAASGSAHYEQAQNLLQRYLAAPGPDPLFLDEAAALLKQVEAILVALTSSDDDAYAFSRSQHTIFAYAAYRDHYPGGAHTVDADQFSFQRAKELNTQIGYNRYLTYWPGGRFVTEAKRAADTVTFREARQQNTLVSYQSYLAQYPTGLYADQANQRLEAISFAKARADGSVRSIKAFLTLYPKGSYRAEADKLLILAQTRAPLRDLTGPTAFIPPGAFVFKTRANGAKLPTAVVEVATGFEAMIYEVTFEQWDRCVASGGCAGYSPADQGWGRGKRPVINVSRPDIEGYLAWFNATWQASGGKGMWRLPSEIEWAYMAKGPFGQLAIQQAAISNGSKSCTDCNTSYDEGATFPVGQYAPNGFGIYDMLGNVGEWVADCWTADFSAATVAPPSGPCTAGTIRGATNSAMPMTLALQARQSADASARLKNVGFRLVRTTDAPPGR